MIPKDKLQKLDKQHFWHPFTQMKDWGDSKDDPLIIVGGEGALLEDIDGRKYLDGNSSIWTNIHGHGHPGISGAISQQLERLAHCSALGFSNEPAILLAEKLAGLIPEQALPRVFFSDNGSTAVECAAKMAIQYRQLTGEPGRTRFLSFEHAYHGDTAGAASLGGIDSFAGRFEGTGFDVLTVPGMQELHGLTEEECASITAVCIEPLVQGAAGMRLWPPGMLRELRKWCDARGILLILDEVMTGFGRTGKMFAFEHEGVIPDFLCLAKGLTGGYLPLAATLTTDKIYRAFLGGYEETFFYGHSYCANPLGCAAALANLEIFEKEATLQTLQTKILFFEEMLSKHFYRRDEVVELRNFGMIAGIEIGPYPWRNFTGVKVCRSARKYGLLTRPIRDTLILMPPLCISFEQIEEMTEALVLALNEV